MKSGWQFLRQPLFLCVAGSERRGKDGLSESGKIFRNGTHRIIAPETTLMRMRRLMPAMGITRIANITGLDRIGIPVVAVIRPNSRSVAVAQGKGISYVAAEASGLMEAIETYHAERIELPVKESNYARMQSQHNVVDVLRLPKIRGSNFHEKLDLVWIEGDNLLSGKRIWVPYELVHTDYRFPAPLGSGCFPASSNGLASGNHILEAISHAICEVVERDATALWCRRSNHEQQERRIDLESVQESNCRGLLEKLDSADIDVAVWDTTTDVGLPAFFCWLRERDGRRRTFGRATVGAGCHCVSHVALSRALTEAAQERLTLISGSRDSLSRSDYYEELDEVTVETQASIFGECSGRRFSSRDDHEFRTLREDVAWELERLQAIGIDEVIAIDLTKPQDFGVPVVRVIIPGLEGCEDESDYVPGERALRLARVHE